MKIAVAGTGYVGLITAVCLASIGHDVHCVDIDNKKIQRLQEGIPPIYEDNLEEYMHESKERLHYTINYEDAYQGADVIFIAVGTPEKKDGSANLAYVNEVVKQIAAVAKNNKIVAIKSTVPVGTNDRMQKLIDNLSNPNVKLEVVSNPEFLSQGTAIHDTIHASRIVLGVESENAEKIMKEVYDKFSQPYVVTNRKSAEMIKYASNDFLALKISFINEIANLCEIVGANVEDVASGMGYDSRIGNKFLKAGIGYGGSCFPKDTKALHWMSNFYDYELKTVKATIEINEKQKIRLLKKARKYYESFEGITVAVLGLAFKPGTDDLREAPSLENIQVLLEEGAIIKAWDPVAVENYKKIYPTQIQYMDTIDNTILDADICFIFTEWKDIVEYDVKKFEKLMKEAIVLDGRNCFDLIKFRDVLCTYTSIGREGLYGK
jgi:UDPglucose 6-dehydrogenase